MSRECNRKNGFGPNGDYCRVHARVHEPAEANIELWRVDTDAHASDSLPERVMARKVTQSSFVDERGRTNRLSTDWRMHFRTYDEAIDYAMARCIKRLELLERQSANVRVRLQQLGEAKVKGTDQ